MAGAFVKSTGNASNAATIAITYTTGNTLFLASNSNSGAGNPTFIVTDNQGNVWTQGKAVTDGASNNGWGWNGMAYLQNAPSGITTVIVNFNGGKPSALVMRVIEYSGLGNVNFLVVPIQANSQNSPGTANNAITSGTAISISAAQVPATVIGVVYNDGDSDTVPGTGSGYTARLSGNSNFFIEDLRMTSAGSAQVLAQAPTHGGTDGYNTYIIIAQDGPQIKMQPANLSIMAGEKAPLQAVATPSSGTLSYQWQDNRSGSFANVIDGTGGTSQSYVTASLATGASGRQYLCIVTDSNTSTTSSAATITVLPTFNTSAPEFDTDLIAQSWYG